MGWLVGWMYGWAGRWAGGVCFGGVCCVPLACPVRQAGSGGALASIGTKMAAELCAPQKRPGQAWSNPVKPVVAQAVLVVEHLGQRLLVLVGAGHAVLRDGKLHLLGAGVGVVGGLLCLLGRFAWPVCLACTCFSR